MTTHRAQTWIQRLFHIGCVQKPQTGKTCLLYDRYTVWLITKEHCGSPALWSRDKYLCSTSDLNSRQPHARCTNTQWCGRDCRGFFSHIGDLSLRMCRNIYRNVEKSTWEQQTWISVLCWLGATQTWEMIRSARNVRVLDEELLLFTQIYSGYGWVDH